MKQSDALFLGLWLATLALAWISMVLRFVARRLILKTVRWDDVMATASLLVATASLGCAIVGYRSSGSLSKGDKFLHSFELLYIVSTLLIKLSFCLTLLPLLRSPRHLRVLMITGAVIVIYSVGLFIWSAIQISPSERAGAWSRPLVIATYAHAGLLIAADLTLAVLSISIVSGLQMKRAQKVSVLLLLLLGSSPFIATVLRMVYTSSLYSLGGAGQRLQLFATFTIIEMCSCIITSAATTLRPLFARLRWFSRGGTSGREPTHAVISRRLTGRSASTVNDPHLELSSLPSTESKIHITRTFRVDSQAGIETGLTSDSAESV